MAIARRAGQVVVTDSDDADSAPVIIAIENIGRSAKAIRSEVVDAASVDTLIQFALDTYGGLGVAVNNAGIGVPLNPTGGGG
jgi:NAD(P)-dependent dehydrogenase (short-subunit alcohol dehydrogenase family)